MAEIEKELKSIDTLNETTAKTLSERAYLLLKQIELNTRK